jgi:D-3-phosphoglycerate dehydrogenase
VKFQANETYGHLHQHRTRGTVNEAALVKALRESWIAFAGFDVFEEEPIGSKSTLLKMENAILTAHVASTSSRMPIEALRHAAHEIRRVLQGEHPISPVNQIML